MSDLPPEMQGYSDTVTRVLSDKLERRITERDGLPLLTGQGALAGCAIRDAVRAGIIYGLIVPSSWSEARRAEISAWALRCANGSAIHSPGEGA